jgi:hypothetical protein
MARAKATRENPIVEMRSDIAILGQLAAKIATRFMTDVYDRVRRQSPLTRSRSERQIAISQG